MFQSTFRFSAALAFAIGGLSLAAAPTVRSEVAQMRAGNAAARGAAIPGAKQSVSRKLDETVSSRSAAVVPLSADEAAQLAVIDQPRLGGQQAAIAAAEQNVIAAAQLPDPRLRAGLRDYPVTGSDSYSFTRDNFTMLTVGVAQEFPREEKRRLRGQREQLSAQEKTLELDVMRRAIERDAALAWLDVYYPRQAGRLIESLQRESEAQIESLGIAYRAGKKSQADVLAEQVNLRLLKDRTAEFTRRDRQARALLARWIGAAAERPLADGLPDDSPPPSLDALLQLVETHPHLNTLEKQFEQAQNEVALARAAYKPDWSLELSYGARPAFSDFIGVQAGIDLPVFTKNRQDKSLGAKLALADQARYARDDALRVMEADVKRYYEEWQSASERLQQGFDAHILPQAKQRVDAALAAYRAGRADLNQVLEARRAQIDVALQRLSLQLEQARAHRQLRYFFE